MPRRDALAFPLDGEDGIGLPGTPGGEHALLVGVVLAALASDHGREQQARPLVQSLQRRRAGRAERAGRVVPERQLRPLLDRGLDGLVEAVDRLLGTQLRV